MEVIQMVLNKIQCVSKMNMMAGGFMLREVWSWRHINKTWKSYS
jgi:hypothetical protein